jgi:hypothetical protein
MCTCPRCSFPGIPVRSVSKTDHDPRIVHKNLPPARNNNLAVRLRYLQPTKQQTLQRRAFRSFSGKTEVSIVSSSS